MFYLKKRNLLIVQYNISKPYIYFFSISNENNEFNLIFLDKITIKTENIYFSDEPRNSCIIKDKYLLIGTKIDKNILKEKRANNITNKNINGENKINEEKINAGLYIINLEKYKDFQIEYINGCSNVFNIFNIRDNIFICGIDIIDKDNYMHKNYQLTTFELLEDNNKTLVKQKYYKNGNYKEINSSKMISDYFIICSSNKDSKLMKINKEGIIIPYFSLYNINKINKFINI